MMTMDAPRTQVREPGGTVLVDALGRKRSPATMPGFRKGIPNGNKGKTFPPETLSPDEILLVPNFQPLRED